MTSAFALPKVADPARLAALHDLRILDTAPEEGFDDIVHLAGSICDAPIALVSLVDRDRQWFKARIGFPRCQTDLDASVCAHVLAEPDLLVIPDLAVDPRTRANPLVTRDPFIRFYAGAPLRTAEGHVVGSLCVIDVAPRPDGLAARQAADLRALARQVMSQVEMRRLIRERDAVVAGQRAAEASLRSQGEVLQTVTDHVAQAVFQMDGTGAVTFANPAAEAMFGWPRAEMLGRSLHHLLHHHYPDGRPYPADACPLRRALVHGRPLVDVEDVFFHRDGRPRQVRVTTAPVLVDGVVTSMVLTVGDVTDRKRAEARVVESEAHWRGLFERLQEGMVVGTVVRDADGAVVDWRYLQVNRAWATLVGMPAEQAVGRTVRELLPGVEEEWIDEPGDVVDTGETVTFVRQVGQLGRWYEGRISALGPDTFIILFLDVTDRLRMERAIAASAKRKTALARLGDHLRATLDADAMGFTAAAIAGQTLGAAQAAYVALDAGQVVNIQSSWCAPGFTGITGAHRLRDYGSHVADLEAGRTVVVADVGADERTRDQLEAFRAIGVVGFVNVPVVEHGELVAIFLAVFAEPRVLTREEEEFMRAAADRTRAGVARIRAEERQAVLNGEISHRLKNTLAMVQAIAKQTLKGLSEHEAVTAFDQRLMALSAAHDILLQKDWENADVAEVVRSVLDGVGAAGRYDAGGPPLLLGPRATLSTSLLLHELATNASKYGALLRPGGRIAVQWRVDRGAASEEIVLDWRETGGPPAREPTRKGFGSRLLRMGLVGTGGSTLCYGPAGLEATFRAHRTHAEQA